MKLISYLKSRKGREAVRGYFFISPWLLGLIAFQAIPLIMVFYFGFTKYSVLKDPEWIGLVNYIKIFSRDELFLKSLLNTVYIEVLFDFFPNRFMRIIFPPQYIPTGWMF